MAGRSAGFRKFAAQGLGWPQLYYTEGKEPCQWAKGLQKPKEPSLSASSTIL